MTGAYAHRVRRVASALGAALVVGPWREVLAQMGPGGAMERAPLAHLPLPMLAGVGLLVVLAAIGLGWFFSRPVDVRGLGGAAAPGASRDPLARSPGADAQRDSFVVIPDISGYTRFMSMNRFAAGHAQFVISRLLGAMLEAGQPPLVATRVEGDSVVFFAVSDRHEPRDGVSPLAVAQSVVRIVAGFDRARAELVAKNLCPCGACQHIAELELKVVVHRGDVLRYRIGALEDLSGLAVIEAHRLLKNTVAHGRYVLVTEAAAAVRLPWAPARGGHVERYDDVGEMRASLYVPPAPDAQAHAGGVAEQARDLVGKLASNARTVLPPSG